MRETDGGPYLWERSVWPAGLHWSDGDVLEAQLEVERSESRLAALASAVGLAAKADLEAEAVVDETMMTSKIEGERLDLDSVRSSVHRHLGLDRGGLSSTRRDVDGLVQVLLDATRRSAEPLTADRLFGWHASLFPSGRSGIHRISVGAWRTGDVPMQVVSGGFGPMTVHFEAPPSKRVPAEMAAFLHDFEANAAGRRGPVHAALAHFVFVTIHPFDDGNGRIGRAIADLALARGMGASKQLWSLSAQIEQERTDYYAQLQRAQQGGGDLTPWLQWMLGCMARGIGAAELRVQAVIERSRFWDAHAEVALNPRQRKLVIRLLHAGPAGFEGGLTNRKAVSLTRASRATAQRDLAGLVDLGVLRALPARGRSSAYELAWWDSSG